MTDVSQTAATPESFWPAYAAEVLEQCALSPNGELLAYILKRVDPATMVALTELRVRRISAETSPTDVAPDRRASAEIRLDVGPTGQLRPRQHQLPALAR